MVVVTYSTEEEKEITISSYMDLGFVLKEQIINSEGNFLHFDKDLLAESEILTDYIIDVDYRVTMIELGL